MGLIYLDSCVLIYLVQRDPVYGDRILQAIAENPDAKFAISPLVELECLVKPLKDQDSVLETNFRRTFQSMVSVPVTAQSFENAARLRAQFGLRTPDALHLAIARQAECLALWTNDARFAQAAPGFTVNISAPDRDRRI